MVRFGLILFLLFPCNVLAQCFGTATSIIDITTSASGNCTYQISVTSNVIGQRPKWVRIVIGGTLFCYYFNKNTNAWQLSTGCSENSNDIGNAPTGPWSTVVSVTLPCINQLTGTFTGGNGSNGNLSQGVCYGPQDLILDTSPFPVDLTFFGATKMENSIALSWQAENEVNFSKYEIQRSVNALNFETLAIINGNQGGNYQWDDLNPLYGNNYYRLAMIDNDGTTKYSRIIDKFFDGFAEAIVYPNPTLSSSFKIRGVDKEQSINLTNLRGEKVNFDYNSANSEVTVHTESEGNVLIITFTELGTGKKITKKVLRN